MLPHAATWMDTMPNEISPSQKTNITRVHLHEVPRAVYLTETGSTRVVARGWGDGRRETGSDCLMGAEIHNQWSSADQWVNICLGESSDVVLAAKLCTWPDLEHHFPDTWDIKFVGQTVQGGNFCYHARLQHRAQEKRARLNDMKANKIQQRCTESSVFRF